MNDTKQQVNEVLKDWREKEKKALELLSLTGSLRFDRSIDIVLFRKEIYDARPSEILSHLHISDNYVGYTIDIDFILEITRLIAQKSDMMPAIIDVGKMAVNFIKSGSEKSELSDFITNQFKPNGVAIPTVTEARDIILYGFGRIGRLAARRIVQQTGKGEQLRLKAIVIRPQMKDKYQEAEKRAALLQSDSVHGEFRGTVQIADGGDALLVNGNKISLIYAKEPEELDYTEYGIHDAIVIDNTGVFRDKADLERHLRPGVSKVILTAPAKDCPNIVYGINHESIDHDTDHILSAASCTTNAIMPVLKVVDDAFGIEKGHVETIHSYTNDQNLLDNFHKKPRRGRAAPVNMVLTSTGAESAISKVLPHLSGKFTGNAVRVPTPNVSLVILNLTLSKPTDKETMNATIKNAAFHGGFAEQIQYSSSEEYVSSNAIGSTTTSVFDAPTTIVSKDGKNVTLYAWYDNEYGYTCQVVRFAKHVARVRRFAYY